MTPAPWWRRLASLLRRSSVEARLQEEVRFHLDQHEARSVRHGAQPADARRHALREFGNVEHTKENTRDEFRLVWLEDLWRDAHIGLRGLLRTPTFTVVAIATLALGVGAATTMFTIVNGVLLKSLPYPDAGRLVRIYQVDKDGAQMPVSEPNFLDWQARTSTIATMAEMAVAGSVAITGAFEPHNARITAVSRDFFATLGVRPATGRGFTSDDHRAGAPPAAIVSHAYWNRVFGASAVAGAQSQTIHADGRTYQVVGAMPAGLAYPGSTEIWIPRELEPPQTARTAHNFAVIARVAPAADVDDARSELSAISRAMKTQYGADTWMSDAAVVPLRDQLTAAARPTLVMLLGGAALLLIIAWTNVSSLLLARVGGREREWAVRLTLGASRWRVARQFFTETLLLCVAAGAAGVVLAVGGIALVTRLQPGNVPRAGELTVDWTTLAFAALLSVVAAVALSVTTAVRPASSPLAASLSGGARTTGGGLSRRRVREALVVAQVALALVLLAGAGLLTRSFVRVLSIDPGYRTDNALVLDLAMFTAEGESAHRRVEFQDALLARLRALPGVTHAGLINDFPLAGGRYANGQFIEMNAADEIKSAADFERLGAEGEARAGHAGFRVASEEYFTTMGIRLLGGRLFDETDAPDAPQNAALISRSLAESRWANRDPIGRFIQFGNMDGDVRALQVVGVVDDVREFGLESAPTPLLYVLHRQRPKAAARFSVIVRGPRPESVAAPARDIVRALAPDLPVNVRTVEGALDTALAGRRFSLMSIVAFAAVALVLATLGLYGVVAYLTSQRSREIGIRLALGARQPDIVRLVVGRGAALSGIGIAVGLGAALALTRLMGGLLFGVTPNDPVSFGAVVLVMACAVAVASYVPVRRATRLAPGAALRAD